MISKWKNAPFFQLRTGGSGHRFHNGKNRTAQTESNQRPPACNSTALARRAIYDTEWGRRVNNTTLFSFDPVTRDVTILPGAVPASALTGGGDDRGGEGQPRTHLMVGCTFSTCRFKEWTEWDAPISWSTTQTGAT